MAAQPIVVVQHHATRYRQDPGLKRRIIVGQAFAILVVAALQHADGADPQPDQVAAGVGRVTLEIAMQSAGPLRARQFIMGQGKMIHTDVLIARFGQCVDGVFEDREFL